MQPRLLILLTGLTLLLGSLTGAAFRVVSLERRELEVEGEWSTLDALATQPGSTRISARLSKTTLNAGENALFEVCSQDALGAERWRNSLDFVVWRPSTQKMELRVTLDDKHLALVKRSEGRACLTLGGGTISARGDYALDAVWKKALPAELRRVPLRARVLARTPLGASEGLLILGAGFGAMLSVLAGFSPASDRTPEKRTSAIWAVAGTGLAMLLAAVVLRLPIPGSIGGLSRGLLLACVEIGVALLAARLMVGSVREGLALHAPPSRASMWLLVAVLCAAVLHPLARLAMEIVPASGRAPIETFISWPSGALAFAALGMSVPLAEELFFRGFVFGSLSPLGKPVAFVGTVILFTSVHAQQAWGNWGALLAVTITGIVLTALRAATGSTLVPAVAHLLYNLSLWRDSFGG